MRKYLILILMFTGLRASAVTFPEHTYPSSFMDSNGDGYGDLDGIRSKLDYIKVTSRGGTMTLKIRGTASVICRIIN